MVIYILTTEIMIETKIETNIEKPKSTVEILLDKINNMQQQINALQCSICELHSKSIKRIVNRDNQLEIMYSNWTSEFIPLCTSRWQSSY